MLSLQMADQRAVIRKQTRFDPRAHCPPCARCSTRSTRAALPEAVIRTGMLLVKAGGGKRRLAQMEHTRELLEPTGILRDLDEDQLRRLLHEETLVVEFEPERAKRSLAQAGAQRVRSAQAQCRVRRDREGFASSTRASRRCSPSCASSFPGAPRRMRRDARRGAATKAKAQPAGARRRNGARGVGFDAWHRDIGRRTCESRRTRSAKSAYPPIICGARRRSARSRISRSASTASAGAAR